MAAPQALVTRFFQLVDQRQFAEAERELQRIKLRMRENEWNRGYYAALLGIMLSTRTNSDQYLFLPKLNRNDKKILKAYRKEFLTHVNNRLNADYDRGFFSAWADYTRILLKTLPKVSSENQRKTQQKPKTPLKEEIKESAISSVKRNEKQTDIFQFLSATQQRVEKNPEYNP
jgi:CRISPR/Cas system CSM-associated protein Csm5 (group 7 of RAMP superfamily)